MREEIEILENKTGLEPYLAKCLCVSEYSFSFFVRVHHVYPADVYLTAPGFLKLVYAAQKGGFSAA